MDKSQLNASLVIQADLAFVGLSQQINHLIDLADRYQRAVPDAKQTLSRSHKCLDLSKTFKPMASLLSQLAEVLRRWKQGEPRVLSVLGVEVELLNELWAHCEALTVFFIREDLELHPFNRSKAHYCLMTLLRINKIID